MNPRNHGGLMPVVVLKMQEYGSLGIVRSLGRLGVPVYGVDPNKSAAGFSSKYCAGKFIWDIDHAPESETISYLEDVAKRIGRPSILIPTSDELAVFVAENAPTLCEHFHFPLNASRLAKSLSNKMKMNEIALEHGVPTPETRFPNSRHDVIRWRDEFAYPVLLKGIEGNRLEARTGKKMVFARTAEELLYHYDRLAGSEKPDLIIQEFIPGAAESLWIYNGYFDRDSTCLFGYTGLKLRQNPVHTGMTAFGMCKRNESLARIATEFMKVIGYRGIVDIDFRYDARDRQYKILDVNPRIGATFRMFTGESGVDVVRALYFDLIGEPVQYSIPREGRKWFVEDKDLFSSFRYWREGSLRIYDLIRSYAGVEEAGYFAQDDFRPFFGVLVSHLKKRIGKILRLAVKKSQPLTSAKIEYARERTPARRVREAPVSVERS
jgi:predicted ATP-grasp superfamily ATP-dependent carboligase